MIENQLERIAVALEAIAANGGLPEVVHTPTSATVTTTADPKETTLSPQQKAAATRKANAAKKKAEAAAAQETAGAAETFNNVTTINPGAGPTGDTNPYVDPSVVAEVAYQVPANLAELQQLASTVFTQLGPNGNKIGEILAGTYQCSSLSALPIEHYAGFARDISALIQPQ